jgi:serralysin
VLTAGSFIERLTTTDHFGTAAINLTGNELAQDIYGNNGDNILDGAGGDDWMYGRLGNDIFYVASANDRVFENSGEGYDSLVASASYALQSGSSVERLVAATGAAAVNLMGNELSQDIIGNDGSNVLRGGGGDDWFTGGGGNDSYYVDSANDRVFEAAGQGFDTVYVSASFRLDPEADIEVLSADSLGSTNPISLVGTDIAQELWGNMGGNYLDGRGGNDIIYGIGGFDTFAFTTPLGPGNIDRIYGFRGDDTILLLGDIFSSIPHGTLSPDAFTEGPAATASSHRIIYNSSTGALLYDADGSGPGAAIPFATLDAGIDVGFEIGAASFVITPHPGIGSWDY